MPQQVCRIPNMGKDACTLAQAEDITRTIAVIMAMLFHTYVQSFDLKVRGHPVIVLSSEYTRTLT